MSGSDDRTIRIWDAESGQELLKLEGHSGFVFSVSFSPDGRRIVSGSEDKTIRIWDAESGQELLKQEGHSDLYSLLASHLMEAYSGGSGDKTIRIWDAESGRELLKQEGHSDYVPLC